MSPGAVFPKALPAALTILILAACSATPRPAAVSNSDWPCQSEALAIDTAFDGAAIGTCAIDDRGQVAIRIDPEDTPVNCSPWYAFRLHPRAEKRAHVTLSYDQCGHRYRPKVTRDGVNWERLDTVSVSGAGNQRIARFSVDLDDGAVVVAAQEIITPAGIDLWLDELAGRVGGAPMPIGTSTDGRPIKLFAFGADKDAPTILLLGRQHPPEVTGQLAMMHFVDYLASGASAARRFREQYRIVIIPMLNPDGVVDGHWRHNKGGVDLNRDWGPFTQPETQAVDRWLRVDTPDLKLMIDFHSTRRDVFYTLPDNFETDPPDFTRKWLARLQEKTGDYRVHRDPNHDERPVSKGHLYKRFGIPTITYETGDESDRARIRFVAHRAALAMIETLHEDAE